MKVKLAYVINVLKTVHAKSPGWEKVIYGYIINSGYHEYEHLGFEVDFILDNLRDELEYFEPNPQLREENLPLFGEDKLLQIINKTLDDLRDLGVNVDAY